MMFRDLYCDARETPLAPYTSIKFILDTFHDVSSIDIGRNKKERNHFAASFYRNKDTKLFSKEPRNKENESGKPTLCPLKISLGLPPKRAKKYSS